MPGASIGEPLLLVAFIWRLMIATWDLSSDISFEEEESAERDTLGSSGFHRNGS